MRSSAHVPIFALLGLGAFASALGCEAVGYDGRSGSELDAIGVRCGLPEVTVR